MNRSACFAILTACAVVFNALAADVSVTLKNGAEQRGVIVSENANFITLNNSGVKINILKSIIASINGTAYNPGDPLPGLTAPAATGAEPPRQGAPTPTAKPPTESVPAKPAGEMHDVVLQSGKTFRGSIVNEGTNFVTISVSGTSINISKNAIATIDGKPYGTPAETAQPSSPAPQPAVVQPATAQPAESRPAATQPSAAPSTASAPTTPPQPAVTQPAATVKPAVSQPAAASSSQPAPQQPAPAAQPAIAASQPEKAPEPAKPKTTITRAMHTIVLKSGTDFKGTVIDETADAIAVKTGGSAINIMKMLISTIDGNAYDPSVDITQKPVKTPAPSTPQPAQKPAPQETKPAAEQKQPSQPSTQQPQQPAPKEQKPSSPETKAPVESKKTVESPASPPASPEQKPSSPETKTAPQPKQPSETKPEKKPAAKPASQLPPPTPAVQELIKKLQSRDRDKQVEAATALKGMGPQAAAAVPQLAELLSCDEQKIAKNKKKSGDDAVSPSRAASIALIAIGESAVEPLMNALTIRNSNMRANAAFALGEMKDPRGIEGLFIALKDSSSLVRERAGEALGKIRDPRAIPLLVTLLGSDTSDAVKTAAQAALTNLTDIASLIAALKDPSQTVRDNAAYILFLKTAKDFRKNPEQWETWYQDQQTAKQQPEKAKTKEPEKSDAKKK